MSGSHIRLTLAIGAAIAICATPSHGRAGNDDGVILGNEAAMTAAAGEAVVEDGSAIWYNPAGLGNIDRGSIDLSGSAMMLRFAETPGLVQGPRISADGSYYEFLGIPSATTAVRQIGEGASLGLGVFVPSLASHTDRINLEDVGPNDTVRLQWMQQESSQTYFGGLAFGFRVSSNLRFGFVLFGSYEEFGLTTQLAFGREDRLGVTDFAMTQGALTSTQAISVDLGFGFQWELSPDVHLGIAMRSPGVLVGSQLRNTSNALVLCSETAMTCPAVGTTPEGTTVAQIGSDSIRYPFDASESSELEPRFDLYRPARLRVSLAHTWDGGWIGIAADGQHALRIPTLGVDRDWVGNIRIGARGRIDDNISLGIGGFTDFDPTRSIRKYGDTRIDFFGGTLGFEVRNPHELGANESTSDLVFISTFALRYAVGVGQIGGPGYNDETPSPWAQTVPVDTTIHEVSLHVGSALYF